VFADDRGVADGAAAGGQVGLVGVDRVREGCWPVGVSAARELAGRLDRLKPRQDIGAVGRFVVISQRNALGPVAAVAVRGAQHPHAGGLVAPVAERDAGRYGGEVIRLLPDFQLEPCRSGFEPRCAGGCGP
jgi:hypothetical protein